MGSITLQPHQLDAVARLRTALQHHHGALLADDVGLGKTFVALAVARSYEQVHVIAPAGLLPMWREAVRRTASVNVILHSLHRASHRSDALVTEPADRRVLIVVDEAHHLRMTGTLRYCRVAEFVVGHDVLLLTATPVHNSERELRALFALFMGSRADALDEGSLERLIVRRHRGLIGEVRPPAVVEFAPIAVPFEMETLHEILALPDPLPARGGSTAGALIRLGLLRAWCSSDAALSHSIRLRRLRGEALAHAVRTGRHPTRDELRAWIVADSTVQLAFTELLVQEATDTTPLLLLLERHLDALAQLQVEHARRGVADEARGMALRNVLANEPHRPVVAFSQFAETVRSLHRALSDIAGIASIAGREARIASGKVPRGDVLWRIAPRAHGRPPPGEHERVRLLLSTDVLAEGVNLQDAGTVFHLDLPWTDALRRQRVGRCARLGASFDPVHVCSFAPPAPLDQLLKITRTLERKAGIALHLIGDGSSRSESVPEVASEIRQLLVTWRNRNVSTTPALLESEAGVLAFGRGAIAGWMAVVYSDGVNRMVARHADRTSDSQSHILVLLRSLRGPADGPELSHQRERAEQSARRELQEWIDTNEVDFMSGPSQRAVSAPQRAVMARLAQVLGTLPAPQRAQLCVAAAVAERVVMAAREIAAERGLETWLSYWTRNSDPREWLRAWRRVPSLAQVGLAMTRMTRIDPHSASRVTALLVIEAE
jgi:hypothetical protein